MAILELPVRGDIPAFQFRQELEGSVYTLRFRWNERLCRWVFDIANEQDEDLVVGLPIHTDVDIKGRFRGDNIPPGLFISIDETGNQANPDRENFGNDVKFFYQESEDV